MVRHTHISSGWNLWINAHMAMPSLQEPERSLTRIPYRSTWFLAHFRRTAGLARDILSGRERKRGGREENGHTCFNDNVHTQYMYIVVCTCTMYIHSTCSMYNVHTQYMHNVHTQYMQYVQCTYTVHAVCTMYIHSTCSMYNVYTQYM